MVVSYCGKLHAAAAFSGGQTSNIQGDIFLTADCLVAGEADR